MAVVSGHASFFPSSSSSAELDTNNSDDEYDYVSSLAEQIAHAMLDDDEPSSPDQSTDLLLQKQQALLQLSEQRAAFLRLQRHTEMARLSLSRLALQQQQQTQPFSHEEIALMKTRHALHHASASSVSPAEAAAAAAAWDCYSTGDSVLQNRSHTSGDHNLSAFYNNNKRSQPLQPWCSPSTLEERDSWIRGNADVSRPANNQRSLARKESVGTGVFLPRVAGVGSQSRRKIDNSVKMADKSSKYKAALR